MEFRPILSALMRSKTGAVLVALQVAISLAILANALHIVQQRQAISERPSGIHDESTLFLINVRHLVKTGHEAQLARQNKETGALRAVPGVLSVAWTNQMPMTWNGNTTTVAAARDDYNNTANASNYFTPDSLVRTLGLTITEGRDFKSADVLEVDTSTAAPSVMSAGVLVTRPLAQRLWPNQSSYVGKTLFIGTGPTANPTRVIGVVEMLQSHGAGTGPDGYYSLIVPARLTHAFDSSYAIRAEPGQRERVIREAEAALRASSPTPLLLATETVDHFREQRYRHDKGLAWMLVAVSVMLLLVTASGIVGMASLWVNQRRKQIGVRRALGARRADILRYFLLENAMITSVGVASGLIGAVALNGLLVAKLGMERLPVGYMAAGAVVFIALGLIAAYGPAWRAAAISPALATRST